MEHRSIGRSGLSVSAMSVGSWLTLDHVEPDVGLEVLRTAIEAGVTFFDDARYDDRTGKAPIKTGYSEVVFGELFRKGGWNRDDVVVANKAWLEFYPDESVAEETEGSLVRLQMDCIDVMYVVPPPNELRMPELVAMMNELVGSGKIRCWGGLNWKAEQINAANAVARSRGLAPFSAVQLPYNLLYRAAVENKAMREACDRAQVSVHASFGLGGGLLTDKYASEGAVGQSNRFTSKELEVYRKKGVLNKVSALASLAREMEMTAAQLALAYCIKGPHVASVLFGAKSRDQVIENLGAMECAERLDADALKRIRTTLKTS